MVLFNDRPAELEYPHSVLECVDEWVIRMANSFLGEMRRNEAKKKAFSSSTHESVCDGKQKSARIRHTWRNPTKSHTKSDQILIRGFGGVANWIR